MELAFFFWVCLSTIVAAILLLNLSSEVSGMRLHDSDVDFPKSSWSTTQFIAKQVAGSPLSAADKGRRLMLSRMLSPGEGSSKREVEALTAFKDSVITDPMGALKSWNANESDACGWRGVSCSPSFKNIAGLNLSNLGLVAVVPEMIGQLNYLEYLDISNNFISGSIPHSIVNCSSLSYLDISNNQVSGEIPSNLGKLFQLQTLLASHNNLTGMIPQSVGNCSMLEMLKLTSNLLEGAIPLTLGKLSSLKGLSLGLNILSGTVPSTLGNCSSLATLNVSHNLQLGGGLPEELGLLKKMEVFLLYECNFMGAFPIWVFNFTSLIDFEVHINSFTGAIPEEIGQLSEMTTFSLFENLITGPIPWAIVNCTALVRLDLDTTNITGEIPSDIGLLSNLEELLLYSTEITGVIPSSISNCSALRYLLVGRSPMDRQPVPSWLASLARLEVIWITGANLYGEIPPSLGELPNLEYLVMGYNYLGGVLPSSLGNLSMLVALEFSSNELHGEIPFEIAGNLTSLYSIGLGDNFFVGSIPKFSDLYELRILAVEENLLSGKFDSDIGMGNPGIEQIWISGNNFSGTLPDGIGNFSNLQLLALGPNRFSGSIPDSWGNLTSLGLLDLQQNLLEGVIPSTLTGCTALVSLRLQMNKFSGRIPQSVGHLERLEFLNLNGNFLSGPFPSSFANLTQMREMSLSHNKFSEIISGHTLSMIKFSISKLDISHNFISGSWPHEFSLLVNLQFLDVSFNNISGSFLGGLVTSSGLAYLDISVNNFSGTLPMDLGLLQELRFFNAAVNNFDGPIPTAGLFSTENITWYSFLGNPRLCGSPRLVRLPCSQPSASSHDCGGFKCRRVWIPVAVSISAVLLLGIMITCCWMLANHEREGHDMMNPLFQGRIVLSEEELMRILQGGEDNVIGVGAKSIVYKGEVREGEMIALKVLGNEDTWNHDMDNSAMEVLLKEVHTLAQLRHANIIKVLGLCITKDMKAIVLEYMPRGSLQDLLFNAEGVCSLSYQDRLKIILGITEALVHLHHSFPEPIIHRDVKPSNILLGMDLNPKLADFGISRFAKYEGREGNMEASASNVCGTFGYLAPEYATQTRISTKGDVYSYGIVLLQLLTRRKPTDQETTTSSQGLVQLVVDSFKETPLDLLDPTLAEEGRVNSTTKDQLMLLFRVGLLCTRAAPSSRPDMNAVLEMLRQIQDMSLEAVGLRTIEELADDSSLTELGSLDQAHFSSS